MKVYVRPYQPADEIGWLRCRVVAFLDSAYFDNVLTRKETYDNPSIELVAEYDGQIIGLMDVEYEDEPGSVTFATEKDPVDALGAVIHHLAVHPDHRRQGIGSQMLAAARDELKRKNIGFLEAWTRDDVQACRWYESQGFRLIHSYLHVYIDGSDEARGVLSSKVPKLHPCYTFAHYVGAEIEMIRKQFARVHDCKLYRKTL